jgi:hypothetical protein
MMKAVRYHVVPALLAAITFFVTVPFVETVVRFYSQSYPAISWHGVRVDTPNVMPGGDLRLAYSLTTNRQCPSDIRGFLVAPDGTVPVRYPSVLGGYTEPDDEPSVAEVSIAIPLHSDHGLSPLRTGVYTYRAIATRYCPTGTESDASIPDAKFNLIVPPS